MRVIKRDGREVPFDWHKIIDAVEKANREMDPDEQISGRTISIMAA